MQGSSVLPPPADYAVGVFDGVQKLIELGNMQTEMSGIASDGTIEIRESDRYAPRSCKSLALTVSCSQDTRELVPKNPGDMIETAPPIVPAGIIEVYVFSFALEQRLIPLPSRASRVQDSTQSEQNLDR